MLPYDILATRDSPAFIIYLLDIGASMQDEHDELPKIEHVNEAIGKILGRMVQRSTKGEVISPRYRLAMIAYSDEPFDILGGVQTINQVAQKGKPRFSADGPSDAAAAFKAARDLLKQELPQLEGHPAPMVCHLTDGQYTGSDPEPIAQKIMRMANDDGNVLVANSYFGSEFTREPISDIEAWPGVLDKSALKSQYAQQLFDMSSPLPESYANVINEEGYELRSGSRMLLPGTNYDLVELAFTMSAEEELRAVRTSKQPDVPSPETFADVPSPETIFIAYSRRDWGDFVEPLVTNLRNRGFKVWIDQLSIRRGLDWSDAIQDALDVCERMIVCVSPDSMKSRDVKDEYRYFRDAEKMVLPLICRETRMPYDLSRIQSISYEDLAMLVDELSR